MKKQLIPFLLFLSISINCLAQNRLMYCPEASFNVRKPNIDVNFKGNTVFLIEGNYLNSFYTVYNLYGVLDALNTSVFCTQTTIFIDWVSQYPDQLKNQIYKVDLEKGYFIDSLGNAWFLSKNSKNEFRQFNNLQPLDDDENFITFFNNSFLSNKSRLYKTDGSFIPIEFEPKTDILELKEFDNLVFYKGDSFLTKYVEENGQYVAKTKIAFPIYPFKYLNFNQKMVGNDYEIFTLSDTSWQKSFVLDTQKFQHFVIHASFEKYLQINNTDTGGYKIIDYKYQYADFDDNDDFLQKTTIPDTLYKNFNGDFTAIIGGKIHEKKESYSSERFSPIAPTLSLKTTAINTNYFSLETDSLFKLDLTSKKWKAILNTEGAEQIDYDKNGNVVLYNNNLLQIIDTQNFAIKKIEKEALGNTKNAKWLNHQFWLIETDSTIEIYNSQNEKWISIKNISNIKTAIIDSTQIFCVDNEGFKYAAFSTESAELLSVKYPKGAEQINFSKLKTPIITKIIGYDSLYIFTNGHETNNFAFVLNPTSKEIIIQKYWPYMFDGSRISFLYNTLDYWENPMPFRIKNIAYSGESLIALTDMGFVRFDCFGSTKEITENTIDFYPNPASENITFSEMVDLVIYDINGRKVLAKNAVSMANISFLPKGFYVIELSTNQARSVAKLLKN